VQVTVRLHRRGLGGDEAALARTLRLIQQAVELTATRVNQLCLLQDLNATRLCHPLLAMPDMVRARMWRRRTRSRAPRLTRGTAARGRPGHARP
jgi:hypothetical protein